MSEIIQGPRVSELLTDRLNTVGKLGLRVDQVVVPTFQVGDVGDEVWGYPAVGRIVLPGGGAGNRSEIELALPITVPGMWQLEIHLTRLRVTGAGSVPVSLEIGESVGMPAPTVFGAVAWRDTGRKGGPAASLNGKANAAASGITVFHETYVSAEDPELALDYIIRRQEPGEPSRGLIIRPDVDNQAIGVTLEWRERPPR